MRQFLGLAFVHRHGTDNRLGIRTLGHSIGAVLFELSRAIGDRLFAVRRDVISHVPQRHIHQDRDCSHHTFCGVSLLKDGRPVRRACRSVFAKQVYVL